MHRTGNVSSALRAHWVDTGPFGFRPKIPEHVVWLFERSGDVGQCAHARFLIWPSRVGDPFESAVRTGERASFHTPLVEAAVDHMTVRMTEPIQHRPDEGRPESPAAACAHDMRIVRDSEAAEQLLYAGAIADGPGDAVGACRTPGVYRTAKNRVGDVTLAPVW